MTYNFHTIEKVAESMGRGEHLSNKRIAGQNIIASKCSIHQENYTWAM